MKQSRQTTAAVIGSGVAGLTAAHVLSQSHAVTLFEADSRVGGHAHTHTVSGSSGPLRIDSGFIVHNERTYPHLLRLFRELGVETRPTEMSMSITCEGCGLSYAGGRGAGAGSWPSRGASPTRGSSGCSPRCRASTVRPRRSWPIPRRSPPGASSSATVGSPTISSVTSPSRSWSCVWSCGELDAQTYPARHLFRFLDHHGMLTVTGSPQWRTVVGGSATYVDRLVGRLPEVRRSAPVSAVERHDDGVDVRVGDAAPERFDRVVVATHANQALELLADATPEEKDDLGAIDYSRNTVLLHRDAAILPHARRARASWNYRMRSCDAPSPQVTCQLLDEPTAGPA